MAISGATADTLVLGQAQVGKAITVTASYTDGHGTAESVTSSASAAVANVNDAPTGSVTLDRHAHAGPDPDGRQHPGRPRRAGRHQLPVEGRRRGHRGATASTLVLAQAQVGKAITVTASYTDGHGTAESVTSSASAAVANVNDVPTGSVTLTRNTATQGQTLTAANTLADIDGLGAISYQWKAGRRGHRRRDGQHSGARAGPSGQGHHRHGQLHRRPRHGRERNQRRPARPWPTSTTRPRAA